jgi:hypothetical protein
MRSDLPIGRERTSGLVEVLDRVLDKGLVVAGDIKVSLAEVELLTIRIRLIVCSIDKAREIGLDWWTHDRELGATRKEAVLRENEALRAEIRMLAQKVSELERGGTFAPRVPLRRRRR